MKSIILMGIKHCGKSTQGKLIAKQFSCSFFDTDDIITERTGRTPRDIYSQSGKDAFLEAEADACDFLAQNATTPCVIATGGGICNNQAALDLLKQLGLFVFLNVDETTACDRIIKEIRIAENGAIENLPAYIAKEHPNSIDDVRKSFHSFYMARQKIYHDICDVQVDMKTAAKIENMNEIISALKRVSL